MNALKLHIVILLIICTLPLIGAGCTGAPDDSYPPKPPVPGFQQSPAIDFLTP